MSDYALYEGDTFITMGTLAEISKETGITERMLKYYRWPSYFGFPADIILGSRV